MCLVSNRLSPEAKRSIRLATVTMPVVLAQRGEVGLVECANQQLRALRFAGADPRATRSLCAQPSRGSCSTAVHLQGLTT
jgi:hypothetical protein